MADLEALEGGDVGNNDSRMIVGDSVAPDSCKGAPAWSMRIRLPSYRALPLCCVQDIVLKVDGRPVAPESLALRLAGSVFELSEFGSQRDIWWWILDEGELLIRDIDAFGADGQADGHLVELALVTVEPYLSAGRFSFSTYATKRMSAVQIGAAA